MKKVLFTLLLAPLLLFSQENGEREDGIWFMYFGTNKIDDKLSIHSEAQFRYYETIGSFNQMLLRTGLNYHINDDAIATLGYGYIDTDPTFEDGDSLLDDVKEHRIFQQFILKNQVGKFAFEHRYRLEQRFISSNLITNLDLDNNRTEYRARYRIQVTHPINETFFVNFYDELFINLQDNLFGQNRLYGAIGAHVAKNTSIQIGFLRNQFSNAVFNRFQIGVFYNPDLRRYFNKEDKEE